jgi:hypothetical protein
MAEEIVDTLDKSVADAIKDTPALEATAPETEVEAAAPDKEVEEESPEASDFGLNKSEQVQAQQLFAALKDPEQAPKVLKFLAEQAGYIKTEKQAEAVKDDIMSVLAENLGPEFEIITKRLGPALDKIISKKMAESQEDIRSAIKSSEEAKLASEADSAMSGLAKRYFDADKVPDKIQAAMQKQMDKMTPDPGASLSEYLNDVFAVVAFKEGITAKTIDKESRIARNRTDAPSRLASARVASPKEGEVIQNGKMSLSDSVKNAVEALGKPS